jgi:hypothetical protein
MILVRTAVLLSVAASWAAAQVHDVAPGSRGNELVLEVHNRTGRLLSGLRAATDGLPEWLTGGAPALDRTLLRPDSTAFVTVQFDASDAVGVGREGTLAVELYEGERRVLVRTVRVRTAVPRVFALLQNYPNPFNPSTTIRFDLPEESLVRVAVYDLLGREVERLVDEVRPAGFHAVTWRGVAASGAGAASGVYFCRMESRPSAGGGAFSAIRRMLLLR